MGWAGYPDLAAKVFPAFTADTGIKVNFTEQASQDDMYAQAKLSLQTAAYDVVEPTGDRVGGWAADGLVQAWDTNKLAMDNYLPGLADGAAGEMATVDGKRMIVPSVWGTEALVYSKKDFPTEYGKALLGDLWGPDLEGKICIRAHSSLAAMGRWQGTGQVSVLLAPDGQRTSHPSVGLEPQERQLAELQRGEPTGTGLQPLEPGAFLIWR
jgi:spermidine/putrescine transport system substrate-binding protein